jgi:hypothetical protein
MFTPPFQQRGGLCLIFLDLNINPRLTTVRDRFIPSERTWSLPHQIGNFRLYGFYGFLTGECSVLIGGCRPYSLSLFI